MKINTVVEKTAIFIDHFGCPMGVTIWTIGKGGQYVSEGPPTKIFVRNLVETRRTKIPFLIISPSKKG